MSTLLFWQGRGKGANAGPNGRNWIHAPDALVKGHVAYLVKFLGSTQVDQPKGIEVVKDAIKKLQFSQQLKKSETKENAKCKKVEITISVDGVAVQEPRTTNIMHQFPLHRISYCADDKGAKKYFSFIAKGQAGSGGAQEQHECFVFISTKLASEITLTIGQAFDLAYRRFLTDNGKYIEMQKLTLHNKKLELQMNTYKNRLQELSKVTYKDDLNSYLNKNGLQDITQFSIPPELEKQLATLGTNGFNTNGKKPQEHGADISSSLNSTDAYNSDTNDLLLSTPPPMHNGRALSNHIELMSDHNSQSKNPVVGTKLEGLLLNSDSDSDFDPRACETDPPTRLAASLFPPSNHGPPSSPPPPLLAPPPKSSKRNTQSSPMPQANHSDLFGSAPFAVAPVLSAPTAIPSHPFAPTTVSNSSAPNYDISDFNMTTSVFNSSSTSFTNGLAGYDPFETQKMGNGNNIFGNGFGNGFNGFGGLSEKQTVTLDSNFSGFLDKTISEMKDGFSRGISFGNDDFSLENLDPLKKN